MSLPFLQGRRLRWLIASIIFAALSYLAFSLWVGWREVLAAFAAVGAMGVLAALGLSLMNYGLRFLRWQGFLAALGHPMPMPSSGLIYLAGFALTTTPGKAGELLRGVFLKQHGIPYTNSTAAFLSERLSDLVAIVLLALIGATLYPQGGVLLWSGVAAVLLGLLLLTRAHQLLPWAERLSLRKDRLAQAAFHLIHLLSKARACHRPRLLLWATALSLSAWAAEAYAFYLILGWLGLEVSMPFAFSIYALSMLAGALSFLPGGLGGAEAVMVSLLLWAGMPEPGAVAATLIIRLATLWFAVALGILSLMLGRVRLTTVEQGQTA
ncbi:MAG: flippase-like domain-containing protein [Halothiobacillaceae bacterium]